ncbi:tryptophan--tRNA ligase [Parafilimonas terrae]|uniref:Tryptophan--tRNA ligase n=1 Tax=Parafilimonas terrae TaxID=1465490 RepID=A0A1I5YTM8_9BACT|nr:tryptophan--tRNA ligase [Parafilimonas terrae]SFQ47611.1 tryptophanyl-tRNA synthetase [Parafilimonas terrae]
MAKETVLSGIRPTGFLHLGNYFGAVQNWVRMQHEYNCYFCVVDWHSLTTHPDTKELRQNVHRLLGELLASGLDPDQAVIYVQSDVPEIAELYLYLNMLAYKGELEKTVTFKDKVRQHPQNVNAGLLTYPVLMASDILIHRATRVPVGKDQEQHLEMARNFGERFNHRYGEVFPMPSAFNYGASLTKILGLDGNGKMSKSANQMATIYLADDDDLIRKKIMKAKTDSGPTAPGTPKPDYIENLFLMMQLVSNAEIVLKYQQDYENCTIRYGDMKKQLAEDMVAFIRPIREKAKAIENDKEYLTYVIKKGGEKARANAMETIKLIRNAMGLNYV